MNGISVKYVAICGILLFSLIQTDETRDNQLIEAHLDLIKNENQIAVVGSVISTRDTTGARIRVYILRFDRSLVHTLLDSTVNLQVASSIMLKDLNNGEDITFSLEYLYGKYVVVLEISGGNPLLDTVRIEKSFQTELIFLEENILADIPDRVAKSHQYQYYLPCCSSKVAEDINKYFEFNGFLDSIL